MNLLSASPHVPDFAKWRQEASMLHFYRLPLNFLFASSVACAVLTAAQVAAQSKPVQLTATWPQFRGPGGQATSPDGNLPTTWSATENIDWKTELPGAGTSSPIILGDRIYLTTYSGYNVPGEQGAQDDLKLHLVALNRNGKIIWTRDVAPKLPEQDRIREEHGYASSTPVADLERVYVFFGKTGMLAFDHGGNQLWQTSVGDELHGWGTANSPILYKDLVIINASVESQSLVALDARTGREAWRASGIRESWNTPILVNTASGDTELVVAIMPKILGFDPAFGKQLWSCNTDINWYMAPSLVFHNDVVYSVGGRTGGGLAVRVGGRGDVTSTHRPWSIRKGSNVTSPVYHDGHIYWMHENLGIAYCARAESGEIVYEERVPGCGQVYASPVLADGKIYYLARDGKSHVLPAEPRFEVLAVNSLGERGIFNASLGIADGRIYLRSNRYLYCIAKK
jgi:outer membrane protein assembly factor BamB